MAGAEYWATLAIDEPLAESAELALAWSGTHCVQADAADEACAWYHGSWQTLRLLGVFHSLRSDDDFFLPVLRDLIADGARKVLVSGAADYGLLARLAAAAGPLTAELDVTVIDRCATPLRLNSWYGKRAGIRVRPVQGDVLQLDAAADFDLVCTHSFICFFDPADRCRLLRKWWDCLRPGGRVLTAQRARTSDTTPVIRYPENEIASLARRAQSLAEQQFDTLGVEPALAHKLAEGYGRHHWTYLVRTAEEIRELFEAQSFVLEQFEPPGEGQAISDTPGTPNQGGSVRWRVLARKRQARG